MQKRMARSASEVDENLFERTSESVRSSQGQQRMTDRGTNVQLGSGVWRLVIKEGRIGGGPQQRVAISDFRSSVPSGNSPVFRLRDRTTCTGGRHDSGFVAGLTGECGLPVASCLQRAVYKASVGGQSCLRFSGGYSRLSC